MRYDAGLKAARHEQIKLNAQLLLRPGQYVAFEVGCYT